MGSTKGGSYCTLSGQKHYYLRNRDKRLCWDPVLFPSSRQFSGSSEWSGSRVPGYKRCLVHAWNGLFNPFQACIEQNETRVGRKFFFNAFTLLNMRHAFLSIVKWWINGHKSLLSLIYNNDIIIYWFLSVLRIQIRSNLHNWGSGSGNNK